MINMNEDIEKIIKYFKNDAWFTIFNAEELNEEPYKLLNPIEVNQIIEYMNKLQNNWNELKNGLESWLENDKHCYLAENPSDKCRCEVYKELLNKMQEMEQGKDE